MSHTGLTDNGQSDAWHSHQGEAPAQETHGETNPGIIALVGAVGMVVIVGLIVVLTLYFDHGVREEKMAKQERWDMRVEARSVEAQWRQDLSGYGWVDPAAGVVRVPIDRAMGAVAAEYSGGQ